jgi:hypothetical protein
MSGNNYGAFVPTTNVWDVSEIYQTEVTSPEFKELLVRLYQNLNNMALSLNIKDSAYYVNAEFVNGQSFFPNPAYNSSTTTVASMRQVFRLVINFGALPNSTTTSVAHNLPANAGWTFTRIYGCATNPSTPQYLPIPYASNTANASIELWVDGTNVNIKTASNLSAYTTTYVILEYMKT